MSFADFYSATAGLGDAYSRGLDEFKAEQYRKGAIKLNEQQLDGLSALGALGSSVPAVQAQPLSALGQPPQPKVPSFAGGNSASMRMPSSGGDTEARFVDALRAGGLTNPNGLAAVAAYANHESGYKGSNINGSWSDPSESGQAGTSGGILSWRGDRFQNMRRLTAGAADPVVAQAKFTLTENPDLTLALQNAKSPEEANRLMADAWKFAGYNRSGGEFDARLGSTRQYVARLGGTSNAAPVQMATVGAAPQATQQASRQIASADDANIPTTGSVPVGFQIPGGQSGEFEPGTVASPAITNGSAGALPAVAGQPRITPERVQLLRQMLQNPLTAPQAQAEIQRLSAPAKTEYKELGGRVVKTDDRGNISAVPGFEKPAELKQFKGADGNDYVFNPQTGQATRAIQGKPTEFRSLITPQERAAAGIPTTYAGPAQLGPDGELKLPGKASTEVNIDNKGENAFATTANKGIAERFLAIAQEGDSGRTDLAFLGQLRALGSDIGTGLGAQATKVLGDYGIDIGPNTGKVQAYSSLVDKLTPGQRIPGAGATSDFDAKLFKSSLPRLINTPEGNDLISGTLEAVAQDKMARAAIAEKALTGEMKPNEVIRELRNLPSPNLILRSGLSELQKGGKLGAEAPKTTDASAGRAMPAEVAAQARSALADGRQRQGVIDKLKRMGFDPSGL